MRETYLRGGLALMALAMLINGCGDGGGTPSSNDDRREDVWVEDPDVDEADEQAPVVNITSSMVAGGNGSYTLEGTVTDDVGVEELTYQVGADGEELAVDPVESPFSVALTLTDDPTVLVVLARDAAGNEGSDTITVSRETSPAELIASFTVSADPQINAPVVFDASSTQDAQGRALTFTWDFGDGEAATGVEVGHLFREARTYDVTLTVEAEDGERASAMQTVDPVEPAPIGTATIEGIVIDGELGPIVGVEVIDPTGLVIGVTDLQGQFNAVVPRAVPVVLRLQKAGWADQILPIEVPASEDTWSVRAQLTRPGTPQVLLDPSQGGEIEDTTSGAKVVFPPDAFVDAQGELVTGEVLVTVTPLVTGGEELAAFPGSFDGMREDGDVGLLATHGLLNVDLSQSGEEIFIAPGKTATIEIPMSTVTATGSMVDLWSLDEVSGLWVREGQGEVVESPSAPTGVALRAEVEHFSWWNADDVNTRHTASLKVTGAGGGTPGGGFTVTGSTPAGEGSPRTSIGMISSESGVPPELELPVGVPIEVQIASRDGRWFGRSLITAAGTESEYEVDLKDLEDEANTQDIAYGETKTVSLGALEEDQFLRFTATKGDYARVVVKTATGSAARGEVAILTRYGYEMLRRQFAPGKRARLIYPVGATGELTLVVRATGEVGDVEVELEKIDRETFALGSALDVTAFNGDDREWVFWANKGQEVHALVFGDDAPSSSLSVEDEGVSLPSTGKSYGGQRSETFEIPRTGLWLLRQRIQETITTPQIYSVSLTEIEPATYAALSAGEASLEGEITKPGKVRRYAMVGGAGDALHARPLGAAGADNPRLQVETETGSRQRVMRSSDAAEGSAALFEFGSFLAQPRVVYVDVYHEPGAVGRYTLELDKLAPAASLEVGAGAGCEGADTDVLPLAARALEEGGAITICQPNGATGPTRLPIYEGLNFDGGDATLTGPGVDEVTLVSWRGENGIIDGLTHLEGVTMETGGFMGVSMNYDRATAPPLTVRDVRVVGRDDGVNATAMRIGALGSPTGTPDAITIERLELLGAFDTGLRLSDVEGAVVDDLVVSGVEGNGVELFSTIGVTLRDLVMTDVLTGVYGLSGRVTGTVIDGGSISLGSGASGARYGIALRERASAGATAGDTLVRGVAVNTSAIDDVGVFLSVGEAPATATVDGATIDGGGGRTVGVRARAAAVGALGAVRVQNSVFLDHNTHALQLDQVDRYAEVSVINNSIRNLTTGVGAVEHVVLDATSTTLNGTLSLFNNIIHGRSASQDVGVAIRDAIVYEADYNLFYDLLEPYERQGGAVPLDANDVVGLDPLFVDATLAVAPTSPAVDAGSNDEGTAADIFGVARPQGTSADIGAHEQ